MKKKLLLMFILIFTGVLLLNGCQPQEATQNSYYEDGTYRGVFIDRDEIQVNIQFTLIDNKITEINFRHLAYRGTDYLDEQEDRLIEGLTAQYQELIDYLNDKDIRVNLENLYHPGNIVTEDVDSFTGATVRSSKIISAIRDALNRGVYSYG